MRWIIAIIILVFGLVTTDHLYFKWSVLGVFLFSLPLLLQFINKRQLHIWALWGGLFLVIQANLSVILNTSDYKTLPSDLYEIIDVKAGFSGISGKQTITTDAKGFRSAGKIDYKYNNTFRVFAIGGSTTEEIYIDDNDTWSNLLQLKLSKIIEQDVEVINTGVSGLRARHHLATLQKVKKFHPDMAIFLLGINDWNWHIKDTFTRDKEKLIAFRSNFVLRETLLGKAISIAYRALFIKNVVKNDAREEYGDYYTKKRGSLSRLKSLEFHPDDVHEDYVSYLNQISTVCHDNDIKCVFVTQPSGYQRGVSEEYKAGFWMTPPKTDYTLSFDNMVELASLYNAYLFEFTNNNQQLFCDAASELKPGFENFYDDSHYNTAGSRNMSIIIGQCVEDALGVK